MIFTACLAFGYIPKPWRKENVIFIPKPGRDSYEMTKSFRHKSCKTALHDLVSRIEVALHHKNFAFGTFLDIEGAFDNSSFDPMVMELRSEAE
jgi:hypothetical protein